LNDQSHPRINKLRGVPDETKSLLVLR